MRRSYAFVAGLALVAAACGGGTAARPARPQARIDLGVVAVDARIGGAVVHGSGIVVDGDAGLVVTTAHGVWGARSLKLATQLGVLHGRIVARAPCEDLALVEMQPRIPGLAPLPVAPAAAGPLLAIGRRRLDPGSAALAAASIPVRTAGPAGGAVIDTRLPRLGQTIPLDAQLVPELSGGPVLDADGRLVGMAFARDGAPGVAVPWGRIRARLDELKPGAREMYVGWRAQYRCVGRQNAYARALRPGFRASDARLNAPVPATRLPGTERLDG
jgi:S1-C subfamily serine protease